MRISERFEYAASPDDVFAMMTDREFQALKCEATYAVDYHVDVVVSGETAEVLTQRHLPTNAFPEFVRSMIGSTILIIEKLLWGAPSSDRSRQARLSINAGNAPIALTGQVHMTPGGSGTLMAITGDLTARVPLLSGRIEKAAFTPIVGAVRKERETGELWLAR